MATTKRASSTSTMLRLSGAPDSDINNVHPLRPTTQMMHIDLPDEVVAEVKRLAHEGCKLQLSCGKSPVLKYGGVSRPLHVKASRFRDELYDSRTGDGQGLAFAGLFSHSIAVREAEKVIEGADAALAQLRSQMVEIAKQKAANTTTFIDNIGHATGNRPRVQGNNRAKSTTHVLGKLNHDVRTPPLLTPRRHVDLSPSPRHLPIAAPNTSPSYLADLPAKPQAQKFAFLHFLAIRPATEDLIAKKTHITPADCVQLLNKFGRTVNSVPGSDWRLADRWYKDLNLWSFPYRSQEDRQSAIDNAVRAFDRLRLAHEDKHWQLLLPRDQRGKGKVLSNLKVEGNGKLTRIDGTPSPDSRAQVDCRSPLPGSGSVEMAATTRQKKTSQNAAQTKRLAAAKPGIKTRPATTSKLAKSGNEVSKKAANKKPARSADDEANDLGEKRGQKRKSTTKVKSAEFVSELDDEEADDIDELLALPSGNDRKMLKAGDGASQPITTSTKTPKTHAGSKVAEHEQVPAQKRKAPVQTGNEVIPKKLEKARDEATHDVRPAPLSRKEGPSGLGEKRATKPIVATNPNGKITTTSAKHDLTSKSDTKEVEKNRIVPPSSQPKAGTTTKLAPNQPPQSKKPGVTLEEPNMKPKPQPIMKRHEPSSTSSWFSSLSSKPSTMHKLSSSQSSLSSAKSPSAPSSQKRQTDSPDSVPESKRRKMDHTPCKPSPLGSSPSNSSDQHSPPATTSPNDRGATEFQAREYMPSAPLADLKEQCSDAFIAFLQLRLELEEHETIPETKLAQVWEKSQRYQYLKREVNRAKGVVEDPGNIDALPGTFPAGTASNLKKIWHKKRAEFTELRTLAETSYTEEQREQLWMLQWELEDLTKLYKAAKEQEEPSDDKDKKVENHEPKVNGEGAAIGGTDQEGSAVSGDAK